MIASPTFLARLPVATIQGLAAALEAGWVTLTSPGPALASLGGGNGEEWRQWFDELRQHGLTDRQVGVLLRAVAASRGQAERLVPDLVISGPDVPGVATADTHAVVQDLFSRAEREVLIAGYAFHSGRELFARLQARREQVPELRILFHVDVPRRDTLTSDDSIILRYAAEFRERHWPWSPRPEVWFDPRSLSRDPATRASLHAKMVIVDRRHLLLTSANFTEAAQSRNIEMGLLSSVPHLAETAAAYWEALRQGGHLRPLPEMA